MNISYGSKITSRIDRDFNERSISRGTEPQVKDRTKVVYPIRHPRPRFFLGPYNLKVKSGGSDI